MAESPLMIELNPSERRVYDRLRACVVRSEPGTRSSLRDLILLLPDLTVLLLRLLRDDRVPIGAKADTDRLNVLMIIADDLNTCLRCYLRHLSHDRQPSVRLPAVAVAARRGRPATRRLRARESAQLRI